jgi:hypothetical protein
LLRKLQITNKEETVRASGDDKGVVVAQTSTVSASRRVVSADGGV